MDTRNNGWSLKKTALLGILLLALLPVGRLSAQPKSQRSRPAASSTETADQNLSTIRQQLFTLLRMSPKLTTVIARAPSLLVEHEYVSRNNPELAQFLQDHPEIARSPEFYLFANPGEGNSDLESQSRELLFERAVWPELSERDREVIRQQVRRESRADYSDMLAFVAFAFVLAALLWLIRVFLQNRRWGKIFKVQTDT